MTFEEFGKILPRIKTKNQSLWLKWTLAKYLGDQWSIDRQNRSIDADVRFRPRKYSTVEELEKRVEELEEMLEILSQEVFPNGKKIDR